MLNYCSWDIVNKQIRENVKEGQEEYCDKQYTVILDAECLKKGLRNKKETSFTWIPFWQGLFNIVNRNLEVLWVYKNPHQ